jgi:SAM-dependent methyltransferase
MTSASIAHAYDTYYRSGLYDDRYPRANPNTLNHLERFLPVGIDGAQVLDFGCGSGRYLLPLLQRTSVRAVAFDISAEALAGLRQRLKARRMSDRVTLMSNPEELDRIPGPPVALAFALFGVLAHIPTREARIENLTRLRRAVGRGGVVLVSVPNKRRRFRGLQRRNRRRGADHPEDISYRRVGEGQEVHLNYHLYTLATLRADLRAAGLRMDAAWSESVMPESWVTRWSWVGRLDALLARIWPAAWGYGILAVARPATGTGGGHDA